MIPPLWEKCREQDLNLRTPTGQRPERCAFGQTWLSLLGRGGLTLLRSPRPFLPITIAGPVAPGAGTDAGSVLRGETFIVTVGLPVRVRPRGRPGCRLLGPPAPPRASSRRIRRGRRTRRGRPRPRPPCRGTGPSGRGRSRRSAPVRRPPR